MVNSPAVVAPLMPEIDFGEMDSPVVDLHERMTVLRNAGHRVVPVRYGTGIAWLILRYEDLFAAFSDDDWIPAAASYGRFAAPSQGEVLLTLHGEEHRWRRALGTPPLSPVAIRKQSEALLMPLANELIDQLRGRREADLVSAYTNPYPFRVISRMLGFSAEDEPKVYGWVMLLLRYAWDGEKAIQAKHDFDAYAEHIVEARRKGPRNDIISYLATAEAEGGRRLSNKEIFDYIRVFYPAGAETTFRTLGSMLYRVLAEPALHDRLLRHPGDRPAAVEEILRQDGGVASLPRYTEKPITIAGVDIPAHSRLLFGIASANRDTDVFEDPDKLSFDAKRTVPSLGRRGQHLAFGHGVHFCLGSHLAREELRVTLALMLDRLPGLRLADGTGEGITGTMLRGVHSLPVVFDDVLPAQAA